MEKTADLGRIGFRFRVGLPPTRRWRRRQTLGELALDLGQGFRPSPDDGGDSRLGEWASDLDSMTRDLNEDFPNAHSHCILSPFSTKFCDEAAVLKVPSCFGIVVLRCA